MLEYDNICNARHVHRVNKCHLRIYCLNHKLVLGPHLIFTTQYGVHSVEYSGVLIKREEIKRKNRQIAMVLQFKRIRRFTKICTNKPI